MTETSESTPLVSVVIPTYERPGFLREAIESVLRQTYTNLEVIIIDDGSSEQYAKEVASDFPESVTSIRHEVNRGLSAARNTGIKNASGRFISFLDDDDRWHETKVARQISELQKDEKLGIVTCPVVAVTPEGKTIHRETRAPSGDCADEILVSNIIGSPSRVMIRREVINDIGCFDESLKTKQDWDLYIRICQNWCVAAVEDPLCFRTAHNSMSSSPTAVQRDRQAILQKHENLLREKNCWSQTRADIFAETGTTYLSSGDLKLARSNIIQSIKLDPTVRRLALLLLSYTSTLTIEQIIYIKRRINRLSSSFQRD